MNLERQLADYGQHLRQVIAHLEVPVKAGVAVRPVPPATAPVGGRFDMEKTATWVTGRRGPLIAAAALAAALAIALPLWFVFRGEESPPVVTEPTTTPAVPTTTAAAQTTTSTTVSVPATEIPWADAWVSLVAVSADEAWASWASPVHQVWTGGAAHFVDGAWVTLFSVYPRFAHGAWVAVDPDLPNPVLGLAVAPDGTVWVSGGSGVFSFDGVEWTRRFDYSAGGVAVAPDGTVWIGGGPWLARWEDGSWVSVGPDPQEPPDVTGWVTEDSPGAKPGVAISGGEVWMVAADSCGWDDCPHLLHYDGATLWRVEYDGTTLRDGLGFFGCCWDSTSVDVEAAPNGDIWTLVDPYDTGEWLLGRFDGEVWTTYAPPFALAVMPDPMAVGPDGLVWFALEDGLLSFDGTEWVYHLQGQRVSAVDVAPDGTVWYSDQDGLHILAP